MGVKDKKWCAFCLDYVCMDCISKRRHIIPSEFQLKYDLDLHQVCKVAEEFLLQNNYIHISSQNPLILQKEQLF